MATRATFGIGLTIALSALPSCNAPKPVMTNAQMEGMRQAYPGMTDQCADKIRYGGVEAMPVEVDQCFEMMPQQRWKGLWAWGFELSRFCPAPQSSCSYETPGVSIWLTQNATIPIRKMREKEPWGSVRLFSIDFLGRKTAKRGGYGHMGGSSQEIVVDRMISVSEIEQNGQHH